MTRAEWAALPRTERDARIRQAWRDLPAWLDKAADLLNEHETDRLRRVVKEAA